MNKRIRDSSSNDFPKTTKKLQHQPKELQLTSTLIVSQPIYPNTLFIIFIFGPYWTEFVILYQNDLYV